MSKQTAASVKTGTSHASNGPELKKKKEETAFAMSETLDELGRVLESAGPATVDNERYWRAVRAQFPYHSDMLYLNNGTVGIQPNIVLQAQIEMIRRPEIDQAAPWPAHLPHPHEARPRLAALLNTDPSEIAFTRNSTESMNIIAMGLKLKPEDEILTTTHEHHGGWSCWQNRNDQFGNPIRKIDLHDPPEDEDEIVKIFENAIRPETRVLSFCHVTCTTVWRLPVKKICAMARERGVITVVDGAQSIGMIGVDIRDIGCDFYVSSTHKWLFTPKGTGMLYVREGVHDQIGLGYHVHHGRGSKLTALRFENHATQSPAPMVGFAVAVDFHNAIGTALIEERGGAMAEYLKKGLKEIPGVKVRTPMARNLSASMVSFSIGGMTSGDVCSPLGQRYHMYSRGLHEGGYHGARMSCAIHNTYEEIDALIKAVGEIAANRC